MPDLLETSENGVTILTLNRPERLNALSPAMTAGLKEALERLATDRECGAIVIAGAGRGWCAGGDVKTMESRGRDQTVEDRVEGLRRAHQLPLLIRNHPKVIIGMINGPVAGAGLGLALACDLRIAGKSARFGTAFARIGYSGDYGGSWTLTRLVGTAKARELYFTADMIDAEEAGRLGIVNKVVADDELQAETMALARRIADGPRVALTYIKRNLFAAETESFQTVLDLEAAASGALRLYRGPQGGGRRVQRKAPPGVQGEVMGRKRREARDGRPVFRGVLRGPGVRARADPHRHRDGQRAVHDADDEPAAAASRRRIRQDDRVRPAAGQQHLYARVW